MQLVRWSPFPELDAIDRRMRLVFDEAGITPAPLPAADVYETEAEYIFELEVPGFEEEKLSVEVFDHTLTIKGERVEEKEEQGKSFRLQERLANEFERRFELPPRQTPPRSPPTSRRACSPCTPRRRLLRSHAPSRSRRSECRGPRDH